MLVDETALTGGDQAYDVVVIGAGAAGLTLAEALGRKGHRVLVVEAGASRESRQGRDDYAGVIAAGSAHPSPDLYRVRALGGTSSIWGGRCIPFDPIDVESRDWVPHSGWPLAYEAIAPYYPAALAAAEAGSHDFDPTTVLPGQPPALIPGLDPTLFATTLERFSRPTNFWTRFGDLLRRSDKVHVLPGTPVTQVHLQPDGRAVAAIEVVGPSRQRHQLRATAYVLASGGLETTRLLLLSNRVKRQGIGNGGDQLGRYYMSHLCTTVGTLTVDPARGPAAFDYARDREDIYVRRRLWVTAQAQRDHRLLNTTFRTHLPDPGDPEHGSAILSAMFMAKSLVQREYAAKFSENRVGLRGYGRHAANIAREPATLARFARGWLQDRVLASRKLPSVVLPSLKGRYALEFHAEQAPNPESRVTLSETVDRHGLPRLHVDWRLSGLDLDSLHRAHALLGKALAAAPGTGRLSMPPGPVLAERVRRLGIVGGHHIGTTRMAETERAGVVDRNCRVHGTENLYVASASVLPTSGQANPTLTVLALALRLSDHLHDRLAPLPARVLDHAMA